MIALDLEYEEPTFLCDQTLACLRLWAAVLYLAITDFRRGKDDTRKGAVQYLFFDDSIRVGSFSWICLLFNRDPNVTREHIYPGWRRDILGQRPKPQLHVRKSDFYWAGQGAVPNIPVLGAV